MQTRWLLFTRLWPAHDERQRRQARNDDRHDPEAVLEAERIRLGLHGTVGQRQGLLRRGGRVITLSEECALQTGKPFYEIWIAITGVCSEIHLMRLILPRQEHGE